MIIFIITLTFERTYPLTKGIEGLALREAMAALSKK